MKENISYTPKQAHLKAMKFCAYQERCHQEVMEKLAEWGVYGLDAEAIIAELIQENYINEERFAKLFAGSKFRVKSWGRIKIRNMMKQKRISEHCIRQGLAEIDELEYDKTINKLIEVKWKTVKGGNELVRKHKTAAFVVGKGFEPDLVWEKLKKVNL